MTKHTKKLTVALHYDNRNLTLFGSGLEKSPANLPYTNDLVYNLRIQLQSRAFLMGFPDKAASKMVAWIGLYAGKSSYALNEALYKQIFNILITAIPKLERPYLDKDLLTFEGMKPLKNHIALLVIAEKASTYGINTLSEQELSLAKQNRGFADYLTATSKTISFKGITM